MAEMDPVAEYQRLKRVAVEQAAELSRAEGNLQAAEERAKAVADEVKAAGFGSLAEVRQRREQLEQEIEKKLAEVKEAMS